jgi:ABC-2 type transport system ATP-binding protein
MSYVLQTFNLSKRYKNQWALRDVNMNVSRGDIYGFVGENGSGKTTVIRLVTGLIFADEGHVELFGVRDDNPEILAMRKKMGAIVESPSIYMNMSAAENLRLQCSILGIKENVEEKVKLVLSEIGLSEQYGNKKHASNFSLGMRQRLGIGMALLGEPELIILDEPMNGLDPAGIVEIRELILKLNREKQITFLISSHILSELALVATKYGIISKGKIVKEIKTDELMRECRPSVLIDTKSKEELLSLVKGEFAAEDCSATGTGVRIFGEVNLNGLLKKIIDAGIVIDNIVCVRSSIEDYYLSLIGGINHG